jgi:hypothetical protein
MYSLWLKIKGIFLGKQLSQKTDFTTGEEIKIPRER